MLLLKIYKFLYNPKFSSKPENTVLSIFINKLIKSIMNIHSVDIYIYLLIFFVVSNIVGPSRDGAWDVKVT